MKLLILIPVGVVVLCFLAGFVALVGLQVDYRAGRNAAQRSALREGERV